MEKNRKKTWIIIGSIAIVAIVAVCLIIVFSRDKKGSIPFD